MLRIAFFLALTWAAYLSSYAQQRVWVDTDIRSGKLNGDMDDALAMLMLLRDSSVHIEGISLVHGVSYAQKVTDKLLGWYGTGRSIPVYRGASSYKELGQRTAAVDGLTKALEAGPLIILALGPATNITTVLQLRPDLHRNVKQISFCAGRRPGMVFSPGGKARFSDYNFDHDSTAGRLLLGMDVPITLAGYDCSDSLFISHADYVNFKDSDNPGDRWLYRKLKRWEGFWRTFVGTDKGFIPFDCATIGAVLYPDEFLADRSIPAFVDIRENDTQNTVKGPTKAYLMVERGRGVPLVDYCHHTRPAFKARLLKAIGGK